jgi:hypothetical protein
VLTQEPKPPDPDQIFSKPGEDTSKASMLGERNVDSVLFKVTDLPDVRPAPPEDSAPLEIPPPRAIEDAKMSSGLVDINTILEEGGDDKDRVPVGSLVAEMKAQARELPAPTPAPQSKAQTYVLVAGILALLAVVVMLAVKAMGS